MRLSRLERVFERHPIYFLTACTHRRLPLLHHPDVYHTVQRFAEAGPQSGAWLGAYVLMPDHWHGFLSLDFEEMTPSAWVKSFKNTVSKTLRALDLPGPHWQKGFFDHILRSGESYRQKWEYVRENPVRAGLVTTADEWAYQGQPFPLEFRHKFLP